MKKLVALLLIIILLRGVIPARAQNRVPDHTILYIPAIRLDRPIDYAPIVEENGLRVNDVSQLGDGVAWLDGTAWVTDSSGRVALAGHNPGAFDDLDQVKIGDLIYLFLYPDVTVVYQVVDMRVVNPAEYHVLRPDDPGERTLILVTCSGLRRLVVIAERVP